MKYLLMYIWKVLYWIIVIAIVAGLLLLMGKGFKMLPDSTIIKILAVPIGAIFWGGGTYILSKPLIILDEFFEAKASLDKNVHDIHQKLIIGSSFSLILFLISIYFFQYWLEIINDTINRKTENYFTVIIPLIFLFGSINVFRGSFIKEYREYKDTIRREDEFDEEKTKQIFKGLK